MDSARISTQGAQEKAHYSPLHKRRWHAERWCRVVPCVVRRIIRERRHTRQAHTTGQHDMFWCDTQNIFPMRNRGVEEPSPLRIPEVRRFPVQRFQAPRPISSRKSWNAAGEGINWKDPSGRKGKTFDWIDVSILGRLERSPGRKHSASSCVVLRDTGTPASSISKKV